MSKDAVQPFALHRIIEPGIEHIDIERQLLLAVNEMHRILIGLESPLRIDAQPGRDTQHEFAGLGDGRDRIGPGARHPVRQARRVVDLGGQD